MDKNLKTQLSSEINTYVDEKRKSNVLGWLSIHGTDILTQKLKSKIIAFIGSEEFSRIERQHRKKDTSSEPIVDFDVFVATKYLSKKMNAEERGLEFNLSLTSMRNLCKAKRCYFSGIPLTDKNRTIDRVDNKKGYIKGNVVACCKEVNTLKGQLENESNVLNLKSLHRMCNKLIKLGIDI